MPSIESKFNHCLCENVNILSIFWDIFKVTGATQPTGKISLNKNYLISLGKYIIATDVKCYHTIFSK